MNNASEMTRRRVGPDNVEKTSTNPIAATTEDEDMEPLPSQPSGANMIAEESVIQTLMQYFERLLIGLDQRWRNWIIRGIFSWVMILGFAKLVSMGPLVVSLVVLLIQIKCFQEIINIGYYVYKSHNLPGFRTLSWFFLFTSNYWLYGESMIQHFGVMMNKNNFLQPLVTYHRMISFLLYTSGFVGFVLSLKKTYYLKQFTLFGYTHITLMILVTSSNQMIQNICEGSIKRISTTKQNRFLCVFLFFFSSSRNDLVFISCFVDYLQRYHGVHVWLFLRTNTVDKIIAQKNLGRFHRWRPFNIDFRFYSCRIP